MTTPVALSQPVAADDGRGFDGLWYQDLAGNDYNIITSVLYDYHEGVTELYEDGETEEAILTDVSEQVVEVGEPLATAFDTTTPQSLEENINDATQLRQTDVRLVFSLLDELDQFYKIPFPRAHILAASRRAFLFKSIVAASLNFYLTCEAIDRADELTDKLRWDFYLSLAILLVEIALAKYPFDYRIAWRGTRYIHNQFLVRAQSLLGPRVIAVIMKIVHWSVIRRQVTVDFVDDFYNSAVKFLLVDGHGKQIYHATEEALASVGDQYSLARLEDYGTKTVTELGQDAAEFVVQSLLIPLAEHFGDTPDKGREQLRSALEAQFGMALPKLLETDPDDVWRDAIELLVGELGTTDTA